MRSNITPGQTSDHLGFDLIMDNNLPEPCVLLADLGYDSDNVRKTMEARNVVPVIPMRKFRKRALPWTAPSTACATSSNAASASSRTPVSSYPLSGSLVTILSSCPRNRQQAITRLVPLSRTHQSTA